MKTNEQIIKEINQIGKGKYTCHNPRAGKYKNSSSNLVIVKCLKTGKLSKPITAYHLKNIYSPFEKLNKVNPEQIIKEINKYGKGKFICHDPCFVVKINNFKCNLVIVKCIKTGKLSKPLQKSYLKTGVNPFKRKKRSDDQIIKEVNKYGKGQYICHIPRAGKDTQSNNLVIVKCLKTGKLSIPVTEGNLRVGRNPFVLCNKNRTNDQIIKEVNKCGKGQYICVNPRAGISKQGNLLVTIKDLKTGKISKPILKTYLKQGYNPFNENQNRVEVTKIQPQYEKIFKKLNIPFIKEYRLGRKRIDFLLFPQTKRIGLEVKQSDKWHSDKNQISTYKQIGSLKQYQISQVLLSDPLGKHKNKGSISIKQLSQVLLQMK